MAHSFPDPLRLHFGAKTEQPHKSCLHEVQVEFFNSTKRKSDSLSCALLICSNAELTRENEEWRKR